jgi:hypothetical protein
MKRWCFISFKTEDIPYKIKIQTDLDVDMIDRSLNTPIDSNDEDYILRKIREEYLSDSTVTIYLIGSYSSENLGKEYQKFIKRELQASLYHGANNTQNGILGVVLPSVYERIYKKSYICSSCGLSHTWVDIGDSTTIKEFSFNYYIPNGKCSHIEDERFCVLVKWDDFKIDPNRYIEQAFQKREHPVAEKTRVYPH